MIWAVIELCPQPWHSVDSPPRYSGCVSPIRLTFAGLPLAGLSSVVIIYTPVQDTGYRIQGADLINTRTVPCSLSPFLSQNRLGDEPRAHRQAVAVARRENVHRVLGHMQP